MIKKLKKYYIVALEHKRKLFSCELGNLTTLNAYTVEIFLV